MNTKMPLTQLTAWLIAAISAPVLSFAGDADWLSALLGASVCTLITVWSMNTQTQGWADLFKITVSVLYLGTMAREAVRCWQDSVEPSLLSLVLLSCAALAAWKGLTHAGRIGAALFWLLIPGICVILLAGTGELHLPQIRSGAGENPWTVMPVLLLPMLTGCEVEGTRRKWCTLIMLLGIVTLAGTLWLNAANVTEGSNAFYEYAKGVTLFGIAKRFEALSACLLTAGWFALMMYVFGSICETAERSRKGSGRVCVLVSLGVAGLVLYNLTIPVPLMGILCLISWGILPLLTQLLVWVKKSKKRKKTA